MARSSTLELLEQLQTGDLTSLQLTQQCLDRIAARNDQLNAFVQVSSETALESAERIDQKRRKGQPVGLLAGIPLGVKDNLCTASTATTCGSRMLQNYVPPMSAHVVEKIQAADGVILGKLNLDEFAMGSSSETSVFGPVRNPWNTGCTAGGSSGGSAAAVAAGLSPLTL
ncbi:MAG: amidase, partial [Planctomycetaceae bacterium]